METSQFKNVYQIPETEVFSLETSIIICTSPGNGESENPGGGMGF
jgi:hypothetical protein